MDAKTELDLAMRISSLEHDMDMASMLGASIQLGKLKHQLEELRKDLGGVTDAIRSIQLESKEIHKAAGGGVFVTASNKAVRAEMREMLNMLDRIYDTTGEGCPLCGHGCR